MRRSLEISKRGFFKQELDKLTMTGVVLAGGKSSRMQRNKAFLEFNGQPLIERSLELLDSIFAEVMISSNQPELYAKYGVPIIADLTGGQGPLGGLQACLQASSYQTAFFVACDMPFLQPGLISYLAQWTEDFDIVVPANSKGEHYLHAFYNRRCLPIIEKNLKGNSFKVQSIYADCQVRYVQEAELWQFGNPDKILCNVNTPEEWAKLELEE